MNEQKSMGKGCLWVSLAFGIGLVSISMAYYFAIFLPDKSTKELLLKQQEFDYKRISDETAASKEDQKELEQKQAADIKEQVDLAKRIQSDCLKQAQGLSPTMGIESTYADPIFYPYEDVLSLNKNERLVAAIGVFQDCINNYQGGAAASSQIDSMNLDANFAMSAIDRFITSTIKKHPEFCDSYSASVPFKYRYCPK